MDANGTRYHLLQGQRDWARTRVGATAPAFAEKNVQWDAKRSEVTLFPEVLRFVASPSERTLTPDVRRGAARDQFENWYWIAPDRRAVFVRSSGSDVVSQFWPVDAVCDAPADGGFRPAVAAAPEVCELQGLAITEDHYLVVGVKSPGGLLIFDLYSGGAPRRRIWPAPLEPFALAPRKGGGVWMLDRARKSVWELDRRFEVRPSTASVADDAPGRFAGVGDAERHDVVRPRSVASAGWIVPANDPVSVADVPGGGVLVLDRADAGFARVFLIDRGEVRSVASTRDIVDSIEIGEEASFELVGYDMALVERSSNDPTAWIGRLFVSTVGGNQSFAFGVEREGDAITLTPLAKYYPMRLHTGRALVVAGGVAWYDSGDDWVRLLEQRRPRYREAGELWTPVFDSLEPSCVWHRMMIDACIPPGAAVDVYTRASDDWRELTLLEWLSPAERRALGASDVEDSEMTERDLLAWQPEPRPYLRGAGSELPYLPPETGADRGTWELLFQRARGRYLQIRLVLRGDGRSTPRIRALRAWYPRFSYLERYLPAVYRDDAESASFLDRFLANIEGMFTGIEDRIAAAQMLFDVATAPADALDWLGRWFGVALDPSWDEHRRRLFIKHATEFFAMRGTMRGLQLALRLALDECVDERLFARPDRAARRAAPVRIIERFRSRRTPRALLGDVDIAVTGPVRVDADARWNPTKGVADLRRRYREAFALSSGAVFPIVAAGAPDSWSAFAERTLGFVPNAAGAERARWRNFLESRYETVSALQSAHQITIASFDDVRLPTNEPTNAKRLDDWRDFLELPSRPRRLWQEFLARRYRNISALNRAWQRQWSAFGSVSLNDQLPPDGPRVRDWFEFEGIVLSMHRTAHRFTVMLPVPPSMRTDTPAQQRRLAIAKAVLDLEKPAHTSFDMRFYWAMFRVGEARVGDDTIIDNQRRSVGLMAPMVLGEGYLAEAFLAARAPYDAPNRLQIARDRLGRSTRLGGP